MTTPHRSASSSGCAPCRCFCASSASSSSACERPAWLPPMAQWQSGLVPYRLLLATQAVVLALMFWIASDFGAARVRGFSRCRGWDGSCLSGVISMPERWSFATPIRMARRPDRALVRRHDPHHLSHGPGRLPVDVRAAITPGSRDLLARADAASCGSVARRERCCTGPPRVS